eukprot:gene7038-410_t
MARQHTCHRQLDAPAPAQRPRPTLHPDDVLGYAFFLRNEVLQAKKHKQLTNHTLHALSKEHKSFASAESHHSGIRRRHSICSSNTHCTVPTSRRRYSNARFTEQLLPHWIEDQQAMLDPSSYKSNDSRRCSLPAIIEVVEKDSPCLWKPFGSLNDSEESIATPADYEDESNETFGFESAFNMKDLEQRLTNEVTPHKHKHQQFVSSLAARKSYPSEPILPQLAIPSNNYNSNRLRGSTHRRQGSWPPLSPVLEEETSSPGITEPHVSISFVRAHRPATPRPAATCVTARKVRWQFRS